MYEFTYLACDENGKKVTVTKVAENEDKAARGVFLRNFEPNVLIAVNGENLKEPRLASRSKYSLDDFANAYDTTKPYCMKCKGHTQFQVSHSTQITGASGATVSPNLATGALQNFSGSNIAIRSSNTKHLNCSRCGEYMYPISDVYEAGLARDLKMLEDYKRERPLSSLQLAKLWCGIIGLLIVALAVAYILIRLFVLND